MAVAGIDIRVDGLDSLVADMASMGDPLAREIRGPIAKGALNIKTGMRSDLAQSAHFGQAASSVTYDTRQGMSFAEAEIGPETAGQVVGDLAHFAWFGGANGGGGTVRDPQAVLDEEAPRLESALGDVLDRLIGR